jgi:dephospho-CoA kinase
MIIGLTGGIATGKSTASRILEEQGTPIVDADKIAREVVEPGKEAYAQILLFFGEGILLDDKSINRPKLGEIIFTDSVKRAKLNEIVHPAVRKEMKHQANAYLEKGNRIVIMDIPLLFESNLTHLVDETWLIYTSKENQLDRLMTRDNFTEEQALSRINAQMPIDEKRELADVVIENNGTVSELKQKLTELISDFKNRPN